MGKHRLDLGEHFRIIAAGGLDERRPGRLRAAERFIEDSLSVFPLCVFSVRGVFGVFSQTRCVRRRSAPVREPA